MLPQTGLQELVRQVVPGNDPHDLGKEKKTHVTCTVKPTGATTSVNTARLACHEEQRRQKLVLCSMNRRANVVGTLTSKAT